MSEMNEAAGSKLTILIVDDDAMVSHPLTIGLKEAGYEVAQLATGEAALSFATAQHPAVIMLDYSLPDINGIEVLRQLRNDMWGKTVPVIFATNTYEVDVMNTVMELGVRDYVLKADMNLDEIVKLVGGYAPLPQA
jgi:DNA-binding response OmpR family regulator